MDNQFRPQGFSILPVVVKNLLIINIIFFLATWAAEVVWRIDLSDYLGLHYIGASDFSAPPFPGMVMGSAWALDWNRPKAAGCASPRSGEGTWSPVSMSRRAHWPRRLPRGAGSLA